MRRLAALLVALALAGPSPAAASALKLKLTVPRPSAPAWAARSVPISVGQAPAARHDAPPTLAPAGAAFAAPSAHPLAAAAPVLREAAAGDYTVTVLERADGEAKRYAVILGETHVKDAEADAVGRRVVAAFGRVGHENYSAKARGLARPFARFNEGLYRLTDRLPARLRRGGKGSTIHVAAKREGALDLEKGHRRDRWEDAEELLFPSVLIAASLGFAGAQFPALAALQVPATAAELGLAAYLAASGALERFGDRGWYQRIFRVAAATVISRNKTMIRNIAAGVTAPAEEPLLAVMGHAHVPGVAGELIANHGFTKTELPLSAPPVAALPELRAAARNGHVYRVLETGPASAPRRVVLLGEENHDRTPKQAAAGRRVLLRFREVGLEGWHPRSRFIDVAATLYFHFRSFINKLIGRDQDSLLEDAASTRPNYIPLEASHQGDWREDLAILWSLKTPLGLAALPFALLWPSPLAAGGALLLGVGAGMAWDWLAGVLSVRHAHKRWFGSIFPLAGLMHGRDVSMALGIATELKWNPELREFLAVTGSGHTPGIARELIGKYGFRDAPGHEPR